MSSGGQKRDWKSDTSDTTAPAGTVAKARRPGQPWTVSTQLSAPTRVLADVASIALDRGVLLGGSAAGTAELPEMALASVAETPVLELLSDAEVMLRVAAETMQLLDYLVEKFRRPMNSASCTA
jgi:hypothetical protein